MNKFRRPLISLAAFTLFGVAATWMVFGTLQRGIVGQTKTYSAIFTDVSGMGKGDDVRVAGVRVGRVDKIDLVGTLAKVTFRVQRNQVLYADTVASVIYQNILGQRYLGLSQGAVGNHMPLPDHSEIPNERTVPSFDVSVVLNGFEPLFTQLDAQQVDNLTNAIVGAFQGDANSVFVLTSQASALAQTLAGPDQVLGDVIGNMDVLVSTLAGQNANLQAVLRGSRSAIAELANRRQDLVGSVGSIGATVGRLATIVDNIAPDLEEFIGREPGFLDQSLHEGRARFAYMGANLPLLLKGMARIMQDGAYLNAYGCDVDLALWRGLFHWFRAFVDAATPSGHAEHTPICR